MDNTPTHTDQAPSKTEFTNPNNDGLIVGTSPYVAPSSDVSPRGRKKRSSLELGFYLREKYILRNHGLRYGGYWSFDL